MVTFEELPDDYVEVTKSVDQEAMQVSKDTKKRKWLPLMLLVYFVGVLWHCIHPSISVFTGRMSPRSWYIDENSLDPTHFQKQTKVELARESNLPLVSSMCDALQELVITSTVDNISCWKGNMFELARISAAKNGLIPNNEAIVLVVPASDDWRMSQFHYSMVRLVERLSSARWLAKSILLVSPYLHTNTSLEYSVELFLKEYSEQSKNQPLPLQYTGSIIRNLLVFQTNDTDSGSSELRILPQGRRGVLPNMDLVFCTMSIYKDAAFTRMEASMVMHPFRKQATELSDTIKQRLPSKYHDWAKKLIDLLLFERSLALGPYPPHASALDRGIDSLTIQGIFQASANNRSQAYIAELVQRIEYVVRALSNLHERLHHSTSLYLLIGPQHFVKHEEYLVPNLLLIVPCVIRVLTLVLVDILQFDWIAAFASAALVMAATILASFGLDVANLFEMNSMQHVFCSRCVVGIAYVLLILAARRIRFQSQQSIQVVACLFAVYIHVALAFGHVSLAFASALFWTPWIAFPFYKSGTTETINKERFRSLSMVISALVLGALLVASPLTIVPTVFANFTPYVRYAFIPLHMFAVVLLCS